MVSRRWDFLICYSAVNLNTCNRFNHIFNLLFAVIGGQLNDPWVTFSMDDVTWQVLIIQWNLFRKCQEQVVFPDKWSFQAGSVCMKLNGWSNFSQIWEWSFHRGWSFQRGSFRTGFTVLGLRARDITHSDSVQLGIFSVSQLPQF